MTVRETNDIPLLDRFSRRKLRRQKAQEDHVVTFAEGAKQVKNSKSISYTRSDSVTERYAKVGGTGNVRKYKVELLQKTEDGNYDGCKQLLEKGADVNQRDEETGFAALHIAAKNGNYDILRLLLENHGDCNAQDKTEQTPLHLAVKKDNIFCCQMLLEQSSLKVNESNKTYDTALHYAAKEGRYEICEMLLGHNDIKVNAKNKKGMTALHYATQENQSFILQLLLSKKADFKSQDRHNYLALHYAAQKGLQDCCQVLISSISEEDREMQLKTCLKDGKTPLMLAAKGGYHSCCEIMGFGNLKAKDKEGNTALHYAAQGGYDYTVTQLLEAGADPNTQNKKGSAPVLEAAGKKKFGCLKILATKGANLNVFDKQKKNVLHYAAEKNALETLKFLLTFPVLIKIIDKRDNAQCSPIHLAIKREADLCAILLLEKGASPTEPCIGGMTPLHLAADKGSTSICEILLSKKEVQVSQENDSKATPLHMAAFHGSTDVCQMLIRRGARLTAVDDKGKTALHIASAKGHANVVKYLSKKGIPVKAKDDTGSCALHLAASEGHLECCQALVSCAKATCWEIDQNGELPLDKSFKKKDDSKLSQNALEEYDQVFKYLLKNLCHRTNQDRMFRIHKYMDRALAERRITIIEAIVDSCWWQAGISGENGHQCPNFRLLIERHPCIALKLQNKSITRCKETGSKVTYDFTLFEDNYFVPSGIGQLAKSPFDEKTHRVVHNALPYTEDGLEWKNNHPLTLMIRNQRHQLLHHPLVKMWLWQKWSSYIYIIFLLLLLIELLFAIFLASFMGITDNWMHVRESCKMNRTEFCGIASEAIDELPISNSTVEIDAAYNESRHENSLEMDNYTSDGVLSHFHECNENLFLKRILWYALMFVTSFTILLEFNYIWRLKREYFFKAEHHLQVLRAVFTLILLIPAGFCEFNYMILNVVHWQCGIIALLLTWLHLVNTLNQLPMLSVFMPVTMSFAKSFFKVLFYIVMIVFIFAFIFHLLLKNHGAFSTVPQAMVKTIVWMLGDLAYDDTFLTDEHKLFYPIMVNFLFVVFVTILGGFIANLVITQPANKLDDFRDKASFHRAAGRTELFLKLDICFPFFRKHRTLGSHIEDENKIDYSFFSKKLLMLDTKEEIQAVEEVNPLQVQLEEINKQFSTLLVQQSEQREEIRDLKHQLNFLIKLIPEQKQT